MAKRITAFCLILLLLAAAVAVPHGKADVRAVEHQHESWPRETEACTGLDRTGSLTTHLPIVIICTDGAPIPGSDPADTAVLRCSYRIIQNPDGINCSRDTPVQSGSMDISIRGNSSRRYPKKQYGFQLVDEKGEPRNASLLGMPAESSWVLNGSHHDESCIRNYMLYNLSAEIMSIYTPRSRFCEVMLTDSAGVPRYEGVYLLTEKIKVSENRLGLADYDPAYAQTPFLVQTNSHTDNLALEHLKPDSVSAYPFDLEYPRVEELTENSRQYIQNQLLRFEKALHDAAFTGSWEELEKQLDLDSFVDYYLINEFFQNYDAGIRSTYLGQDLGGKIFIGPVWDFDGAFDNFSMLDLKPSFLQLKYTIFYSYLSQNPRFIQRSVSRYQQLRRGVLSEAHLLSYIDDTAEYLGSAPLRNCDRWYRGDYSLYRDDLARMKQFVMERGRWMDENFKTASGLIE